MRLSDSKNIALTKLRRNPNAKPGAARPSNLGVIDNAWAADALSDDELSLACGESSIAPLLEDEGELCDDAVVTAANSGSAASGALERRRKEEGRWNDLGLDLFEDDNNGGNGNFGDGSYGGSGAAGGGGGQNGATGQH